jgi:glutamate carboxypeptidase
MPEPLAQTLLALLRSQESEMCRLLVRLAEAESPSLEPAAQEQAFSLLAGELERLAFAVRRIAGREVGDHLYARPSGRLRGAAVQLLVGHLDTVWPLGTIGRMPARWDGERVFGPGVLDMKAGLVQLVFALGALRRLELRPPATPVVFVASDEEIGSRESRRILRRLAAVAARAFVLEPAFGPAGRLKTSRKGVGRFTVTVTGRAAHAGVSPEEGVSAILELAHQIQRLFALNDPERGVTVNVGTIGGGLRANVVAPEARAIVDARVPTDEDARVLEAAIRALRPLEAGSSLRVEGGFGRPPMQRNERNLALWREADRLAGELGLSLEESAVGGASDANLTSQWTATLDGLGGVGDGAHAEHEHVLAACMPERAALLALLLMSPVAAPAAAGAPERGVASDSLR